MKILLVFDQEAECSEFKQVLQAHDNISVTLVSNVDEALGIIKAGQVEAVAVGERIGEMDGVKFIDALIQVNPMVNTALASSLAPEDYHEVTEGQGVLIQLAVNPGKEDADLFIEMLQKVASLM